MILDRVESVTDKPLTTIINMHTHRDRTGSNIAFPETVEVVAHDEGQSVQGQMYAPDELRRLQGGGQREVLTEANI